MLTPVVFAADYADTIQFTDRTDVRIRATQTRASQVPGQQTVPIQSGLDAANIGGVLLNADGRSVRFSLAYSPSITFQDIERGINAQNPPQVLQSATALAAWHAARSTTVTASETASYGHINSAYLFQPGATSSTNAPGQIPTPTPTPGATTTPVTAQLAPPPSDVYFGSSGTSLSVVHGFDRRTTGSLGAGYSLSGGLNSDSQVAYPLSYGPRADANFGYALSRSLRTVTTAIAQRTDFTPTQCYASDGTPIASATRCRPAAAIAQISQGLRDSISRRTTLSIDAGLAFTEFRTDAGLPYDRQLFPSGGATITHTLGTRGTETLVFSAQISPLADVRTGRISYGAQGVATLLDSLSPAVAISISAIGSQTFPTDSPLAASIVQSEVDARFRADRRGHVVLVVGESELWQSQGVLGGFLSIYGFFAVTVATSALRF